MALDMKSLGLKIGLEIHQQLDTNKLFCSCPSLLRDDLPNFTVKRNLRAVAGESGEVDIAAKAEQQKTKTYFYEGYNDTTCLVELDEEPPHNMNLEALSIVLQISKLFQATMPSEIQVMRKTIVNGSVVSGFQRTALVGMDGRLEGSFGTISIPTILIEEDACKDIAKNADSVTYRMDRQGIPLIEISTGPDITDPNQCQEVAAYIGMVLRSTEKVKRGLGTIRQDLNISIAKGNRIEIKGAQDLKLIPQVIEYEAMRQNNLVELSQTFKSVDIGKVTDVTNVFKSSTSKVIAEALKKNGVVLGIRIGKMKGIIGKEIQPGRRVGTELSDYAKVYGGVGGIFHCDELPKYGITQEEVDSLGKFLSCKPEDGFVIVADTPERTKRAMDAVIMRLNMIPQGVIKEVRSPNADGTSSFMRPIPGAARLYPETDVHPIIPDIKNIELPELWTDKVKRLVAMGLGNDLAQSIVSDGHSDLFFYCVKKYPQLKASFMAENIVSMPKVLLRKYNIQIHPTIEDFKVVFEALSKGEITRDAILEIFRATGPIEERIASFAVLSDKELEAKIKSMFAEFKGQPQKAVEGRIIDTLKIRADAQKIIQLLQKISH